jgi:hypothetical protein
MYFVGIVICAALVHYTSSQWHGLCIQYTPCHSTWDTTWLRHHYLSQPTLTHTVQTGTGSSLLHKYSIQDMILITLTTDDGDTDNL